MPRTAARIPFVLLLIGLLAGPACAADDPPRIVTSIAPIHSLVAAVTDEAAEPYLLVPPGQSPHTFSLAPSDTRAIARADAIFTVGGPADRFLERTLGSLAGDSVHIELLEIQEVHRLPARSGGHWHHAHGDADHAESGHSAQTASAPDGHTTDPHAWLDPENAIAFARAVAATLAELDPARAPTYRANAAALAQRLTDLDDRLHERLTPIAERPYLVFHDAYQYFERRYGLNAVGSVVVDPGRPPGAARLRALRRRIAEQDVACLFVEPQFEPRIADTVVEDTGARIATLDPLGAALEPGPSLYPRLLQRMAESLRGCLGRDS